MNLTRYVLMIVIDPIKRTAVGLIKKKGPSFLLGKITYPGGKIEEGEVVNVAAFREMLEETGVEVAPRRWRTVEERRGEGFELFVLAAKSSEVHLAQTCEEEPVFTINIDEQSALVEANPSEYTSDFLPLLNRAVDVLQLEPLRSASLA